MQFILDRLSDIKIIKISTIEDISLEKFFNPETMAVPSDFTNFKFSHLDKYSVQFQRYIQHVQAHHDTLIERATILRTLMNKQEHQKIMELTRMLSSLMIEMPPSVISGNEQQKTQQTNCAFAMSAYAAIYKKIVDTTEKIRAYLEEEIKTSPGNHGYSESSPLDELKTTLGNIHELNLFLDKFRDIFPEIMPSATQTNRQTNDQSERQSNEQPENQGNQQAGKRPARPADDSPTTGADKRPARPADDYPTSEADNRAENAFRWRFTSDSDANCSTRRCPGGPSSSPDGDSDSKKSAECESETARPGMSP